MIDEYCSSPERLASWFKESRDNWKKRQLRSQKSSLKEIRRMILIIPLSTLEITREFILIFLQGKCIKLLKAIFHKVNTLVSKSHRE